jgi:hypothetical protein
MFWGRAVITLGALNQWHLFRGGQFLEVDSQKLQFILIGWQLNQSLLTVTCCLNVIFSQV